MATLHSAAEAAHVIGCQKSTVTRHCKGSGIGQMVGGRLVLTDRDISRLKKLIQSRPGNPNFAPGNYFGGTRQRPEKKS